MEDIILSTNCLTRFYGPKPAVDNISLELKKGEIYGLVGLNGSGKTTLIRLVTGLIMASRGSYSLFGESGKRISKNLSRVSSMVEGPAIYQNFSALDNIIFQCQIAGVKGKEVKHTARSLLGLVGLSEVGNKKAKNFSLGMRQRLGIAMALVGNPEFMLLDEPTNGLDPAGIIEMRRLLQKMNKEYGITILISSHILSELDKMATRFGFIHHGVLVDEKSAEELNKTVSKRVILSVDNLEKAEKIVKDKFAYSISSENLLEINCELTASEIFRIFEKNKINIGSFETRHENLEEYFISLIKRIDGERHTGENLGGGIL